MKYFKCFFLFMMLLCTLSACSKGESNLKGKMYSPDRNITDLVSKTYSNSQLLTITQLDVTMDELNKQYPIECLRKVGNACRVSYLGNDSVAVIFFDSNENKILGRVYNLNLTKADFNELAIGQSLESVQKIDPHGEYLFLYTGSNDAPKISSHYTKDGYCITVEYSEENTILSISTNLI